MKRTATSTRDLERVEVMGRVAQEGLKLVDASSHVAVELSQGETYVATLSAGGQVGNEARPCGLALKPQIAVSR